MKWISPICSVQKLWRCSTLHETNLLQQISFELDTDGTDRTSDSGSVRSSQCCTWTPNLRMPLVTYFPSPDALPVENVLFSWIDLLPLAVFDRSPRLEILIRWWVRWLVILKLSNQSARCHFWSGSDIRKKSRGWEQSPLKLRPQRQKTITTLFR